MSLLGKPAENEASLKESRAEKSGGGGEERERELSDDITFKHLIIAQLEAIPSLAFSATRASEFPLGLQPI